MIGFQTVIKEQKRMCNSFASCLSCPLSKVQGDSTLLCRDWIFNNPAETERVVTEWSAEHPIMTNRKKFEEVFGFNIATIFEVHEDNAKWLDEEYKEKIANE